jgi:hypothetical protein
MVPLENGVCQVVKVLLTPLALIAVTVFCAVVVTVAIAGFALAMGAKYTFRPSQFPNFLVTQAVIHYVLNPKQCCHPPKIAINLKS